MVKIKCEKNYPLSAHPGRSLLRLADAAGGIEKREGGRDVGSRAVIHVQRPCGPDPESLAERACAHGARRGTMICEAHQIKNSAFFKRVEVVGKGSGPHPFTRAR